MADTGEIQHGGEILAHLSRKDLHLFFARNPMPMCLYDPDTTRILEVNQAAIKAYGYSREEFLTRTLYDVRVADHSARLDEALLQAKVGEAADGYGSGAGLHHQRKDGTALWVDVYYQDFAVAGRHIRLAMIHDVTQLRHFADKAREQGEYFRQLFAGSPDGIAMLDREGVVIDVNDAFEEMFQHLRKEVVGQRINGLVVPPEREAESEALSALSLTGVNERLDTVRRRKDGTAVHVRVMSYPLVIGGDTVGAYVIYQDRSSNRKLATELSYQASYDPLTGLINRREFERAAAELLAADAEVHRGFALLHVEIGHFKLVSDSFGTGAGERLLCEIAKLLQEKARTADLVARIGPADFALLLCDITSRTAEQVSEKLIQAAEAARFTHGGQSWPLRLSIGLMHREKNGSETVADLVNGAAMACHLAEEKAGRHIEVFRADNHDLRRQRDDLTWGTRIADAIAQKRLILYMQRIAPAKAPTEGHRYEVLLRLLDDNGVAMPPGALIAAAERFRMMPLIDRYVIDMALGQIKRSRDRGSQQPDVVSINVSGMSLGLHDLAPFIFNKIIQYDIMPGMLCFEITETAAIRNLEVAAAFVADMRTLGCSVVLDDFGTGMASLAYLRNFDVDFVKIDGQFIRDLVNSPFDLAAVEALNRFAQIKGFKTVAECVEDEATLLRLQELGVDYVQGYYLHRPEPWSVGNLPKKTPLATAKTPG